MRINSIQPTLAKSNCVQRNAKTQNYSTKTSVQQNEPSFKGKTGGTIGYGGGLVASMVTLGGLLLGPGIAIPTLAAGAIMVLSGAVGAGIGHKIEEKIKNS